MTSEICLPRLRKELRQLQKNPVENIRALAKESNLLEWHYVLEGSKGSCYQGGYYHGVLTFPKNYPYKPPSITMLTPNGRFKTNTRLCLSMSDFHPETWDPMWSVGTILLGLYSFMHETTPTLGSIESSEDVRRNFAKESLQFNCKSKEFCELFPELKELNDKLVQEELLRIEAQKSNPPPETPAEVTTTIVNVRPKDPKNSIVMLAGILMTVLACTWLIVYIVSV